MSDVVNGVNSIEDLELAILRDDIVLVRNWCNLFNGDTLDWDKARPSTKAIVSDIQNILIRPGVVVITSTTIFGVLMEDVYDMSEEEISTLDKVDLDKVDIISTSISDIQSLVSFRIKQ